MNRPDSEAHATTKELAVEFASAGRRLDQWLAAALGADFSRSRIQALIRAGAVQVGNVTIREPRRILATGETVRITVPEPKAAEPQGEPIPLSILHEDDHVVVIDKPAGLVVHPGAGNWTGTLVNALIHHCGTSLSGIGGVRRPGIVHRLDKDTSGVMVVAKTDLAHRGLARQFSDHRLGGDLERTYIALVWGVPERMAGMLNTFLGRSPRERTRQAVVDESRPDARRAVTHFKVLCRFGPRLDAAIASLVECQLETGRTHQIRVHMASIGHPLIGDRDYGLNFRTKANTLPQPLAGKVKVFSRQALHARVLGFTHPVTNEPMRFETPPPEDLAALIAGFGNTWA